MDTHPAGFGRKERTIGHIEVFREGVRADIVMESIALTLKMFDQGDRLAHLAATAFDFEHPKLKCRKPARRTRLRFPKQNESVKETL